MSSSDAFTNLTYDINKGSKICIIGKSGSGKSTLQDLLLGLLHPNKGEVSYFGKSLIDSSIKSFYHEKIAHVPQSPIIINSSIRENITFLSDQNSEKRLFECIKNVMMSDFVEKNGLNYNCGEEGCNLSGGQRQRIAIARALYSNKEILFLDECTSAIDNQTELEILDRILHLYQNKTVISITHKLNTFNLYDKVLNLDKINT